jgi:hypothetical protein
MTRVESDRGTTERPRTDDGAVDSVVALDRARQPTVRVLRIGGKDAQARQTVVGQERAADQDSTGIVHAEEFAITPAAH